MPVPVPELVVVGTPSERHHRDPPSPQTLQSMRLSVRNAVNYNNLLIFPASRIPLASRLLRVPPVLTRWTAE